MNVANLYDRLNEQVRVSALLLALVRGDDLDMQRLNATAPQRSERRWHHHDRVQAVWNVSATAWVEQLTTLANLWHAQARLARVTDKTKADGESPDAVSDALAREVRLWRAFVNVCCWKLSQHQAAWRIVCERLGIAPEFLNEFGDCIALKLTEARLADNRATAETVRQELSEFGELAGEMATADSIAAGWLDLFTKLEA